MYRHKHTYKHTQMYIYTYILSYTHVCTCIFMCGGMRRLETREGQSLSHFAHGKFWFNVMNTGDVW